MFLLDGLLEALKHEVKGLPCVVMEIGQVGRIAVLIVVY